MSGTRPNSRRASSPLGAPTRRSAKVSALLERPGSALLPLRLFLGVTFCFAALQKISNPDFFRAAAPGSFAAQLHGSILTSPLHHLLDPATHATTLLAWVISIGELAVGLGTLLGCYGQAAAGGGMALSLMFFLTVSINDRPYYYGSDIVFLFAWTPLLLAGPGRLSVDALLGERRSAGKASTGPSPVTTRRAVLSMGALVAFVAGASALIGRSLSGARRRAASPAPSSVGVVPSTSTTVAPTNTTAAPTNTTAAPTSPGGGRLLGAAAQVPVGGAASFTDPAAGVPAFVVQPSAGHFVAFSAVCTHAGCTVQFDQSAHEFVCPCHGSVYNASTGAVVSGPAPSPLAPIAVRQASGQLFVDG
jgi:thiosulfate dehydrogenase (quinone) large subunit